MVNLSIWNYFCHTPEAIQYTGGASLANCSINSYNDNYHNTSYKNPFLPAKLFGTTSYKESHDGHARKKDRLKKCHQVARKSNLKLNPSIVIEEAIPTSREIDQLVNQMLVDLELPEVSDAITTKDSIVKWHIYRAYREERTKLIYLAKNYRTKLDEVVKIFSSPCCYTGLSNMGISSNPCVRYAQVLNGTLNALSVDIRCKPPFFMREMVRLNIFETMIQLISLTFHTSCPNHWLTQKVLDGLIVGNESSMYTSTPLVIQKLVKVTQILINRMAANDKLEFPPKTILSLMALLHDTILIFVEDECPYGSALSMSDINPTLNPESINYEQNSLPFPYSPIANKNHLYHFNDECDKPEANFLQFSYFKSTLNTKTYIFQILTRLTEINPTSLMDLLDAYNIIASQLKYQSRFQKIMADFDNLVRTYKLRAGNSLIPSTKCKSNASMLLNSPCLNGHINKCYAPVSISNSGYVLSSAKPRLPYTPLKEHFEAFASNFSPFSFTVSPFNRSVFVSFKPNTTFVELCAKASAKFSTATSKSMGRAEFYTNQGLELGEGNGIYNQPFTVNFDALKVKKIVENGYNDTTMSGHPSDDNSDSSLSKKRYSCSQFNSSQTTNTNDLLVVSLSNEKSLEIIEYVKAISAHLNAMLKNHVAPNEAEREVTVRISVQRELYGYGIKNLYDSVTYLFEDDAILKNIQEFEQMARENKRKMVEFQEEHLQLLNYDNDTTKELLDSLYTISNCDENLKNFNSFIRTAHLAITKKCSDRSLDDIWLYLDLFVQQLMVANLNNFPKTSVFNQSFCEKLLIGRDKRLIKTIEESHSEEVREKASQIETLSREVEKWKSLYAKQLKAKDETRRDMESDTNKLGVMAETQIVENQESRGNTTPQMESCPPKAPPLPCVVYLATATQALNAKNIPTPGQPLKSLNWKPITLKTIEGTIWQNMNESKIYEKIDMKEFEQFFSAYQKNQQNELPLKYSANATNPKILPVVFSGSFSLIDGRRAQNCDILLTKLKMSSAQLKNAILSVDKDNELNWDMCEQLLKFVPTTEEVTLFNDHSLNADCLAKADRFLYEMSQVNRYEQKLHVLCFTKKFVEKIQELDLKILSLDRACDALLMEFRADHAFSTYKEQPNEPFSKYEPGKLLTTIMELVLALGNYMNRGARRGVWAFSLESLNALVDVKSTVNANLNLMHYLVGIVEKMDCICDRVHYTSAWSQLEDKLGCLKYAAKINYGELETELNSIQQGLKMIKEEIQFENQYNVIAKNESSFFFATTMSIFVSQADEIYNVLHDNFCNLNSMISNVFALLGINQSSPQPNETVDISNIFMELDIFIKNFREASIELDKFMESPYQYAAKCKTNEKINRRLSLAMADNTKVIKRTDLSSEKVRRTRSQSRAMDSNGTLTNIDIAGECAIQTAEIPISIEKTSMSFNRASITLGSFNHGPAKETTKMEGLRNRQMQELYSALQNGS